jgi:hypothetical protein
MFSMPIDGAIERLRIRSEIAFGFGHGESGEPAFPRWPGDGGSAA